MIPCSNLPHKASFFTKTSPLMVTLLLNLITHKISLKDEIHGLCTQTKKEEVNTTTCFTKTHLSTDWKTCFTHWHLSQTETGNVTIQRKYNQKTSENSNLGTNSLSNPEQPVPLSKVFHVWLPGSQTGRKASPVADLPNHRHNNRTLTFSFWKKQPIIYAFLNFSYTSLVKTDKAADSFL